MISEPEKPIHLPVPRPDRGHRVDYALLLLSVAIVYARLLGADFQAAWDDNIYILNNAAAHGFSWAHLRSAFIIGSSHIGQYNPLAILSFMLDYTIWGLAPGGYHLTNIIIHGLNGILVYRLILRLHGDRLVSLCAAALFLLHPVQVESVAWISERKGLLSLTFLLISWQSYIDYREADSGRGKTAYTASLLSFVLALLAKSSSVVLPLILLLYDWCFQTKGRRVSFRDKVPFFIVALIFSAIEIYSEKPENGGSLVGYHGGSPLATLFTMLPVFCRYLWLMLWPAGLNIEHWPPIHRSPDAAVIGAAVVLAGILVSGVMLFRRDRRAGFWLLFFWVGLLPVSQIVPLFLLMYEHYLYMPIIGAAVLAGSGAAFLRDRFGKQRSVYVYSLVVLWLLALSAVTCSRTFAWQNTLTLFLDASAKSPDAFRVWEVLGGIYYKKGQINAAKTAYERSLTLKADNTDVLWILGKIALEIGQLDRGYEYLHKVLSINPKYVKAWASLGTYYRMRGNYAKSEEQYKKALALQPDAMPVVMLLGRLAILQERYPEARAYLNRVEAKGWDAAECAYLMASVESLSGNRDEALAWLEKALQRGYRNYMNLMTDESMSAIWDLPRYNYLLLHYFPEQEKLR